MNNKNVKVVDEHSIDRNANIMFAFDLEGSEYVTYWIERDEDNGNIFVSKVIKNLDGTFNMLDVDDSMEKATLSDIVKTLITMAVNNEDDKLDGDSVTLTNGKTVKFMSVSFNREQKINVQKTYITTVKKEVTRVTEKYYDVIVNVKESNIFDDIFPTVTPVLDPVVEEIDEKVDEPTIIIPVIPESGVSSVEDVTSNVNSTVVPVAESVSEESNTVSENVPTVVEPITVAEPTVNVSNPEPVNVMPSSIVEPTVVPAVVPEVAKVEAQPLVFNASNETNLNAALGELASTASIPVENIEPVREFGTDEVVNKSESATPVQPQVVNEQKAGFANNKFFIVIAVAFFLASCIFLGYEVFNYFQLTK